MPRLPGNSGRDFSASQSKDEIAADIAELFATRPPAVDEFFANSNARMRIGVLIARAMDQPMRPRRPVKSR
jgi:hypothetical protein